MLQETRQLDVRAGQPLAVTAAVSTTLFGGRAILEDASGGESLVLVGVPQIQRTGPIVVVVAVTHLLVAVGGGGLNARFQPFVASRGSVEPAKGVQEKVSTSRAGTRGEDGEFGNTYTRTC